MKIFLGLFLCLAFVLESFGAPLIFKTKIVLDKAEYSELATIDVSKYKQIRVLVEASNAESIKRFSIAVFSSDELGEAFIETGNTSDSAVYKAVIDTPPDRIKIKAYGRATYTIRVWGTQ